MACCTTISPLNSAQKRRTSAMFDFPHSAKRRRPLSSAHPASTMLTTTATVLNSNKQVVIESADKKAGAFQPLPCSPTGGLVSDECNELQAKSELMERIRHEAKRLIRRRQLGVSSVNMLSVEAAEPVEPVSPLHSPSEPKSSRLKALLSHNDVPLFSISQVNQICDKMMKEREQFIREQYDKILADKLTEQYDSFVKFTHEQIQRRFETSQCSYVS
ncbi:subolesin [Brachionus plicatilis]|uniref:Subolesin n=1 Tax=Brachionus plicatilis TaxID=10195 RepID=A0A3M7Q970_BRAPC|nr:subolesin [Brachionus plicatilis]